MRSLVALTLITVLLGYHCECTVGPETRSAVIGANNEFALDLLKKVYVSGKNTFFSPLSISMALAMMSVGAGGKTLDEIDAAFHFNKVKDVSFDSMAVHEAYKELITYYKEGNDNYTVNIANRLFAAQGFEILSQFLQDTEEYYKAAVQSVNFTEGTAEGIINSWVAQQTEDKIKELFKPGTLSGDALLVLVNAIYFKGVWKDEFDPEWTFDTEFHVSTETKKDIKMMSRNEEDYPYYKDTENDWEVLEIPYKGGKTSMVIILPQQGGISTLVSTITPTKLQDLLSKLSTNTIDVKIPKFTMEAEYSLPATLQELGVNDLFTNVANLTGISNTQTKVSEIKHKAFVEVDEVGTKAAAATGIVIVPMSAILYPEFRADRPFLFFIMDNVDDKRVLFTGVLSDP